jgi:hypothetical protein
VNRPLFPAKRDDGSFAVAARFSLIGTTSVKTVEDRVTDWVRRKTVDDHVDLSNDLAVSPQVAVIGPDTLYVVFEGKPGSKLWKDWMVAVTQDLMALSDLTFEGFYDLVTNSPHPASFNLREKDRE